MRSETTRSKVVRSKAVRSKHVPSDVVRSEAVRSEAVGRQRGGVLLRREVEAPGVPVVIEGGAAAAAADPLWDRDALVAKFGDREFHVGGYAFALRDFLASVRRRRRRRRDAP